MGLEKTRMNLGMIRKKFLKAFLFEHLGLRNIKIERAHRTGEKIEDTSKTIVAKFSSHKTKEMILKNTRKLKCTGTI